ncbi:hypothetical protein OH77DRAFT_568348 [Trametes cingulata]|nr:hypothetical protein OH77DRAFT_568348 [Trametes cingulata]
MRVRLGLTWTKPPVQPHSEDSSNASLTGIIPAAVRPSSEGDTDDTTVPFRMPSQPLRLTELNLDVQEQIMSLLPDSSLAALAVTCRYFANVTVPPLCARSGKPFRRMYQPLSFISFLRPESSTPRWPLIKELHFAREIAEASSFFRGRNWLGGQHELLERIVEVLHVCRHLRRLRLDIWAKKWTMKFFAQTISMLSSLEEVRMPLPTAITEQELRKLLRPGIRVFVQLSSGQPPADGLEFSQVLRDLKFLPATLVELDLHAQKHWSAPPGTVFPNLRRLSIGYPYLQSSPVDWRAILPSLTHLTLVGPPHVSGRLDECSTGPLRDQVDRLREAYSLQWDRNGGTNWPPLSLLEASHPCTAHVLAIPRHIPRLVLSYKSVYDRYALDMLYAVVSAAKPVCIDYHISLSEFPHLPVGFDESIYGEFDLLHASPLLRRCVLTIGPTEGLARSFLFSLRGSYLAMLTALRSHVQQSSMTHLLLRFPIPGLDDPNRQSMAERCLSTVVEQVEQMARMLAGASDTLEWIGIYVESQGLKSWELRRPSHTGAGTSLVPMPEEDGWAVLAAEDSPDFAHSGTVPWRTQQLLEHEVGQESIKVVAQMRPDHVTRPEQ